MSSCHVFLQVLAQVSLCQGLPPDICSGCPSSSYPHCLWGGGPGVHRKAFMEVCCWLPDHHPVSGPWLSSSVDSWLDDWQFGVNNLDDYMLTTYFVKIWFDYIWHIWPHLITSDPPGLMQLSKSLTTMGILWPNGMPCWMGLLVYGWTPWMRGWHLTWHSDHSVVSNLAIKRKPWDIALPTKSQEFTFWCWHLFLSCLDRKHESTTVSMQCV